MNLILIGPQGSGKGTQGHRLAEEFDLQVIEMGHILRELSKQKTPLAKKIHPYLESGKLIPSEITNKVMVDYLDKVDWKKGLLFDGYPRQLAQWEALRGYLHLKKTKIDAVIHLDISQKTSIERLASRVMSSKTGRIYNLKSNPPPRKEMPYLTRRSDDVPEAIKTRLRLYTNETKPLLVNFKERHRLITIEAEGSLDEVYEKILAYLKRRKILNTDAENEK